MSDLPILPLDGMQVAILATDGVEAIELVEPRLALEAAGANTVLVSPTPGAIQTMDHDTKSEKARVDLLIGEALAEEFDATLLPGGTMNADKLRMDRKAREFVQRMEREGKPLAAICHAPWLLVSAGLVKGRRLTSYYTLQDDIRCAGGHWEDSEVVVDKNWVTSRQPKDIPVFNRQIVALFKELYAKGERTAKTAG
jgi:protease I